MHSTLRAAASSTDGSTNMVARRDGVFFFFSQNGDEEIEMRVLGHEEHLESRSAVLLDFLGL